MTIGNAVCRETCDGCFKPIPDGESVEMPVTRKALGSDGPDDPDYAVLLCKACAEKFAKELTK